MGCAVLNFPTTYRMTAEDIRREREMSELMDRLTNPETRKETASALWVRYQALHHQRPAGYVRLLEERMGLK